VHGDGASWWATVASMALRGKLKINFAKCIYQAHRCILYEEILHSTTYPPRGIPTFTPCRKRGNYVVSTRMAFVFTSHHTCGMTSELYVYHVAYVVSNLKKTISSELYVYNSSTPSVRHYKMF
jgi:hypothetical protein